MCGLLNCAIANDLDRSSRSFQLFSCENKCCLLYRSLLASPGDRTKYDIVDDIECPLNVIVGAVNGLIDCTSKIHVMYEGNYFYCQIYTSLVQSVVLAYMVLKRGQCAK